MTNRAKVTLSRPTGAPALAVALTLSLALALAACERTKGAAIALRLDFAPDALPAPEVSLEWRVFVRWDGGEARASGAYAAGGTLTVSDVPLGPRRQVVVELYAGDRVFYYGTSRLFDLGGGRVESPEVTLVSAPAAVAQSFRIAATSEAGQDDTTRSSRVDLRIEPLRGEYLRVSNNALTLIDRGERRVLSGLDRDTTAFVWRDFALDVASCADGGGCPRTARVFAVLEDAPGYRSEVLEASVSFDDRGFQCTGTGPGACRAVCGDGLTVRGEACDDGNTRDGDACSADCSRSTGACGDAVVQSNEACDDGNTRASDGCDAACVSEPGWSCTGSPSRCGRRIHVAPRPTGAANGHTWSDAFGDLQSALSAASAGDEIWVAAGSYRPDVGPGATPRSADATFQLKAGVALYGGFAGGETNTDERDWEANATVLDGDLDEDGTDPEDSLHVVRAGAVDETTVLDGFVISGGYANPDSRTDEAGGGLYVDQGRPTLRRLRFSENFARQGGGLYVWRGAPVIEDVQFVRNEGEDGAGLYAFRSRLRLVRCEFRDNRTFDLPANDPVPPEVRGGAAAYLDESEVWIESSHFTGNESATSGGALFNRLNALGEEAEVVVVNGVFADNRSRLGGAAMNSGGVLLMVNTSFYGNCGDHYRNDTVGGPPISECLVDSGRETGGAVHNAGGVTSVVNSILWGDLPREIVTLRDSATSVSHSIVAGGHAGTGNLDVDPLYASPGDDLHLMDGSPAIDAGDSAQVPRAVTVDAAGTPRVRDDTRVRDTGRGGPPVVDLGAYEH